MAIPPIPDYCRTCGNLAFYWHASWEWRCGWCQPILLRNVQFPTEAEIRANKTKDMAPVPIGEPVATKPTTDWFSAPETAAAWPPGWLPPRPIGPAKAAAAGLRAVREKPVLPAGKLLFTAGYQGRSPRDLFEIVRVLNGTVIDIRLHAASRQPGWGHSDLQRLFMSRYSHVRELGNLHYDRPEAGFKIASLSEGIARVEHCEHPPAVLLCRCPEYDCCHRSEVAAHFRQRCYATQEVSW